MFRPQRVAISKTDATRRHLTPAQVPEAGAIVSFVIDLGHRLEYDELAPNRYGAKGERT